MAKAFRKAPQVLSLHNVTVIQNTTRVTISGVSTPERPVGPKGLLNRFKCAWMVFTGKADALTWTMDQ